jgi:Transposase DDE domain
LHRKASKKQMNTKPETLEFAKYVIVFTTRRGDSGAKILEWYRMRWQIELVFKRLKAWPNSVTYPNTMTAARGPGCTENY